MGQLIEGRWASDTDVIALRNGRFERQPSQFRNVVTADGASGFKAEPGRYHLYVSLQCPWAWRTIAYRAVKGLEDVISMSIAIPNGREEGWVFGNSFPGSTHDQVEGFTHLHQAYTTANPTYTGVVSVPVLWDRRTHMIVNNESVDIIRMLNSAFNAFAKSDADYYPPDLRALIDEKNDRLYSGLNNAVYQAGTADNQDVYAEAYDAVFDTLAWVEDLLGHSRYLNGDRMTESDWRLSASLFRFDAVYYSLFMCNKYRLADLPQVANYLKDIYQTPGIAPVVNLRHIVTGYYSQKWNRSGIIPLGPEGYEAWLSSPHDRARTFG